MLYKKTGRAHGIRNDPERKRSALPSRDVCVRCIPVPESRLNIGSRFNLLNNFAKLTLNKTIMFSCDIKERHILSFSLFYKMMRDKPYQPQQKTTSQKGAKATCADPRSDGDFPSVRLKHSKQELNICNGQRRTRVPVIFNTGARVLLL